MMMALDYDNSGPAPQQQKIFDHNSIELEIQDQSNKPSSSKMVPNVVPPTDTNTQSLQELDLLLSPLFEEYFTVGNQSVSKSFANSYNSQQQDTQSTLNVQPTIESIIQPATINGEENNTGQAADAQFKTYEFTNAFYTPIQEVAESFSHNVDTSNMH
ncbi:hypothetical protein Tco_0256401 [Tanacetum coccineum]